MKLDLAKQPKLFNTILIILSVLFSFNANAQGPCKTGWTYRMPVTITSGVALSNYQVSFIVNTSALVSASKMLANGGDIRVTDNSGTDLSFWIENNTINTTTTKIWVKVPSMSGTSTIYLFYGNSDFYDLPNAF
jgi:hypothetical protein